MGIFNRKSNNQNQLGQRLTCGCVMGQVRCNTAEALHARMDRLYDAIMAGSATWDEYEKAAKEYRAHYATVTGG